MTREEAIAHIVAKSGLSAQDVLDLEDAASHENETPGGVAALMRVYARQGARADKTTWQTIAEDVGVLEDEAGRLAPLIGLLVQIAPLL